ncbi:unnamed protein product [Phyllotreta striolata]|uniref:CUB domain-containing protein n=1 Tax=Phyllotreta striolata TaxID=444603 RepID=A0A9N9TYA2_PHYSR|nr:unnamed protein product [Phyllotreta striolata]
MYGRFCIGGALVILLSAFHSSSSIDENSKNVASERHPKQYFLFPVLRVGLVRFENGVCRGYSNLTGTCYTRRQCTHVNGVASSTCAKDIGVCCISNGVCSFTIQKIDANVCQVRIDFLTLKLAQPDANGICNTDALIVTGGASTVPILCGENSGQHMYVDFNGNTNIVISIGTSGASGRSWNIKVTQINCNCPYRAPSGCLQYYNSITGVVRSFNYGAAATQDGTRQLSNENYGICIATITGYCGITWSQTDVFSFGLTDNVYASIADGTLGTINAEQFGLNCTTDFIVIPSPILVQNNTALNTDRFCGRGFSTVTSK